MEKEKDWAAKIGQYASEPREVYVTKKAYRHDGLGQHAYRLYEANPHRVLEVRHLASSTFVFLA